MRVGSVDNGEKYMEARKGRGRGIPMPEGPKIFETTGPWEDYATPSRDMRLLIAMNVLLGLPERIVEAPRALQSWAARSRPRVRDEIAKLHASLIGTSGINYTRSDGSPQKLTVADLLARQRGARGGLQPERLRRGALGRARGDRPRPSTCKRRAPAEQKREDGRVPRLVPRRPPPDALILFPSPARRGEGR